MSATLGEDGKREPPLGVLYVAATLEGAGATVDFRDYQTELDASPRNIAGFVRFLEDHEERLLISCFVDMLPLVLEATRQICETRPGTYVMLGGPGPSAAAREIVEAFPWVDAVVRGEGEETARVWASRALPRDSAIDGMVERVDGTIIDGGDRARIAEIDSIPAPAYHLVDWDQYSHARIVTTRGCPYSCSFCDVAALWKRTATYRGLTRTIDELEALSVRYGKHRIGIVDDTFVLDTRRVRNFCELLLERDLPVEWGCFSRINTMTQDLAELMARAGCRAVFYGIDSGSPDVLKKTSKAIQAQEILPVIEYSAEHFDKVEASFIWGYPFESVEDFQRTLDLAGEASRYAPKVNVQMHLLSPLPNSPIYRSFGGRLEEPEQADSRWLLLPTLLLDQAPNPLTDLVRNHPQIFPGFYCFPTPNKERKREFLERSMAALHRTIGATLLDPEIASLVQDGDGDLEQRLLAREEDPSQRIGVGLALGFLRRARRRNQADALVASRGPQMIRQRQGDPRP